MKIYDFQRMKQENKNISMVTCYDYWSAAIVEESNIDCVLIGDSVAMVIHGHPNTLAASTDLIALHIQAVAKGTNNKFLIGDLPFCSYRKDLKTNMEAIEKIIQAGAQAVKLEGATGNLDLIKHVVESGIPVMGHLGLTPQSVNALGGFKVQGKTDEAADKILSDTKKLEAAGCFAVVLECVPADLGKKITESIQIPTIGIGAGPHTSGQLLVLHDLLGMNDTFKLKFVKKFLNGAELIKNALNEFDHETKQALFPNLKEHCF